MWYIIFFGMLVACAVTFAPFWKSVIKRIQDDFRDMTRED